MILLSNMIVRDHFLPGLSPVSGKTITATFDGGTLSSNGGVLIEIEKRLDLAMEKKSETS
jgi:hypothetical protein